MSKVVRNNLKSLLEEKGITQAEVHRRTGITRSMISNLANNKFNNINMDTAGKICTALDVSLEDLFVFEEVESEESTEG